MTNIKALHIGPPALIRNFALTALLIVAVAVSPKQAHADGVETAAAIMIGAAVLYAAHDSYKDDRRYSKNHVHDRHCGHQVSYRDTGHHNYSNSYNNGYRNQKVYTDVHAGHSSHKYYKGKDYKKGKDYRHDKHDNRSDRFARDNHGRDHQGSNKQYGRGNLNDRQKHNQAYWNTRVNVNQRH
ncbi:hypothetical protein [Zhongshania aliphaticivorans]|uniref:hypothetical protein n=1 Tax=Zhongshania aliphaticivorans TaxID=1470434 RepID=UPI0012E65E6F|nr:hypothetical protein [Zhongshania aliphaticivorans]CAA0095012.1 Uncharacterised protein [Zhongshania aliphaticivorans]